MCMKHHYLPWVQEYLQALTPSYDVLVCWTVQHPTPNIAPFPYAGVGTPVVPSASYIMDMLPRPPA